MIIIMYPRLSAAEYNAVGDDWPSSHLEAVDTLTSRGQTCPIWTMPVGTFVYVYPLVLALIYHSDLHNADVGVNTQSLDLESACMRRCSWFSFIQTLTHRVFTLISICCMSRHPPPHLTSTCF